MSRILLTAILTLFTSLLLAQPFDEKLKRVSNYLSNGHPDSAALEISRLEMVGHELTAQNVILANLKVAAYYSKSRETDECTARLEHIDGLIEKHAIYTDSIEYQLNLIKGANFLRQYKSGEAISALKKSTSIYHAKGYVDSVELAALYGNIANAHYISFQYDSSGKYYQKLMPLLQSNEVEKESGIPSYWSIALYFNSVGLVDSSLIYSQKVLDIAGDPNEQNARVHVAMNTNRSIDLRKVYRVEEALEVISTNLGLVDEFGLEENEQMVIDFQYELAQVYRDLGRNKEAIRMFRKVREKETFLYGEHHINNAYNYVAAGNAYHNLQQFDSALIYYDQAVKIAEMQKNELSYYMSSINQAKGDVFLEMGQWSNSLSEYRLARKRAGFENDPNAFGQVSISLRLAQSHFQQGNSDSAKYYLSIAQRTNIEQGSVDDLLVPTPESRVYSISLVLQSILLRVQLDLLDQGRNVADLCASFLQWRDAFDFKLKNSNDLTQLVNVQEALIETLLNSNLDGDFLPSLLFKLHESNHNKLLVNELEFKNAKRSILSSRTRLSLNSIDQSIAREESQLLEGDAEQTEVAHSKLLSYLKDREALLTQLKSSNPSYYQLRYGSIENIIEEARALCGQDQVAIKFIYTENSLAALLIEADQSRLFRLDHSGVDSLCNAFKALVTEPDMENRKTKEFSLVAHELFQKLFAHYYLEIQNKDFIVFPDGPLRLIPLEALVLDQEDANSYKNLNYLIKNNGINYVHSVQAIALSRETPVVRGEEIAFFNPKYEGSEKLSWTKDELQSVQEVLKVDLFENEQASVSNFVKKGSEYRYIHFAGHGELNDKTPLSSHLKFTKSNLSDGQLTCSDIYKLELQSNMVVLSACETGVGTYHEGEGMISLARAFLFAGAKSVVMSLWDANDRSTALLMSDFYDELGTGARKDLALQKAKIRYLEKSSEITAHPFYWSTFIINGETSPISLSKLNTLFLFLPIILILFHPKIRRRLFSKSQII